jgi:hypothetical protein
MKSCKFSLSTFLTISMFCCLVAAQQGASTQSSAPVPRLVNFTGKAADAQGKPIAGIAGVTFAIYKDQYEGAPLWLETQNIQADAKGNYTAQLGATKPDGLPLDLFSSGDARWLGVTVNGGHEQPRVLLLSVPYALKAADAETIGGLPPSAFVLAAPQTSSATAAAISPSSASAASAPTNPAVTGVGTAPFIPLWDSSTDIVNSVLFQSGTGSTAKVGINTTTPGATLDVNGSETVRGNLSMPATGAANATAGKNSQPTTFTASAFNSGTGAAVSENFRWQAEPVGNNTASTSGTLNLLYAAGSNPLAETGLKVRSTGNITFATGQTFPGTGTVTSVGLSAPSSDFNVTGSPVTKSGTLNLNWNIAPTSTNTVNAIVKRDAAGNFSTNGISSLGLSATNTVFPIVATMTGNTPQTAAVTGTATATGIGNTYGVAGYSSTGNGVGVFGQASSNIGLYGTGAVGVFGTGSSYGFQTDSNVQQDRTMGGWVKGMVFVNGYQFPYTIVRCFNSTLAGAAATAPPCGFNLNVLHASVWVVDFGFQVNDRFVSATTAGAGLTVINACTSDMGLTPDCAALTQSQLLLWTQDTGGNGKLAYFHVIVY